MEFLDGMTLRQRIGRRPLEMETLLPLAIEIANSDGRRVSLYAVRSPENWFEDAGSGQLSKGSARIELDPTFAQTVNTGTEYHVFLTPNGNCKGLYVSQKTANSFEVHELGGGSSSIAFDYRIMAKRSGYENVRLADVTEQYNEDGGGARVAAWAARAASGAAVDFAACHPEDANPASAASPGCGSTHACSIQITVSANDTSAETAFRLLTLPDGGID